MSPGVFLLLLLLTLPLFFELFSVNCNGLGQCLQAESSALLQLKRGFTFGELELDTWQSGTDCCIWEGVTCDESRRVVTGLNLSDRFIDGKIDPSLFNLTSLRTLNLANNQFHRMSIPDSGWDRLANLSILDLSNAEFAGKVPADIFRLSKLTSLDLSDNFGLFLTTNLTFLRNMSNLRELYLDNVNLSAYRDEWCGALVNSHPVLEKLSMNDCSLFGASCSSLSMLPFLSIINLGGNYLNSSILDSFVNFTSLSMLQVQGNKFQGFFPKKIFELRNLTYLDISNNPMLSGSLPDFSEDSNLKTFFCANNNLTGEIPPSICNLTRLQYLDLSKNILTGSIPSCLLEKVNNLRVLNLRGNQLHGAIPHEISPKCELQTIILSENQLEGLLPRSLSNCRSLEILDLGNNNLKDTFPYWLGNISSLLVLVLRTNKFHGLVWPLDGNYGTNSTFSLLHVFDISSNNFSGKLCAKCINSFKSMVKTTDKRRDFEYYDPGQYYYSVVFTIMNDGQLMMPQHFLKIFMSIDFSNNHFEGEIPLSIRQLVSLQVLNMSHNYLTGTIPRQLGKLSQLQSLDLSMNSLSDMIPQELVSLYYLTYLNLSYNKLVGKIPLGLQFFTFPNTSFEGNEGLCWSSCNPSVPTMNNTTTSPPYFGGTKNKSYMIMLGIVFGVGVGVGMATAVVLDVMCCDKSRRSRRPVHG